MFKICYKYFLIVFILSLLFLNSSFVFALEARYPTILGLSVTNGSGLEDYIVYFFGLAIIGAGVLAAVFIGLGGVKIITSGDNPSNRKDAIDIIKNAVLGMILIVTSFMILRTINMALVTPALTALPGSSGIFYIKGSDKKIAPIEEANTSNIPAGYNQLSYVCNSGPALLVWQFPRANFQDDVGYPNTNVQTLNCNDAPITISGGSFKTAFQTPGIYYFLKGGCQGYMSQANLGGGRIDTPFKNNVKSIKIINDIPSDVRYGAVFHDSEDTTRAGVCTMPLLIYDLNRTEGCFAGINVSSSVEIFVWNAKNPEKSGQGIDFYSEPWGWSIGARAGKYSLSSKDSGGNYWNYWDESSQSLAFNYNKVDRPASYKQIYQNFYQHPGSIDIKGNYLVMISAPLGSGLYCQTFYKDAPNLNETEFYAIGNRIDIIDAIPLK